MTRALWKTRDKDQTGTSITADGPTILPSQEHPIREEHLPLEVVWILNRLRWAGHLAYVVGGGVRDLLLGQSPKDFDLSTDATPQQIQRLFYNCRIIGRRFRIAHIYFRDGHVVEVSTFRSLPSQKETPSRGPLREDNEFGPPAEDAWRRDLTVNGLFYDSETGDVIDHVGGLEDLKHKLIRTISEPNRRFQEDPVRMIRAIRHAARLDFSIDPPTWRAIRRQARSLNLCADVRVLEEFMRELRGGVAYRSLSLSLESGLLAGWLPSLSRWLLQDPKALGNFPRRRFGPFVHPTWGEPRALWNNLSVIDEWLAQGQTLDDIVLLGAMFLPLGWSHVLHHQKAGVRTSQLWHHAFEKQVSPIIRELKLRPYQREAIFQIFHVYWKLHLFPSQNGLSRAIRRSSHLDEALALFQVELQANQLPRPAWLQQFGARAPVRPQAQNPTTGQPQTQPEP